MYVSLVLKTCLNCSLFALIACVSARMIGAIGSRHRRRGSSPQISVSELPVRRLSARIEEEPEEMERSDKESKDEDKDVKSPKESPKSPSESSKMSDSPPRSAQRSATTTTATPTATTAARRQSIVPNGTRTATRLSITELPAGARLRQRRRAVEITDQRTCVLLHSRLKGMKLEDIA